LQIFEINNLVSLLFSTVWCSIFHDRMNLIINDDRSTKVLAELYLACTDLDDFIDSSSFNLALEHRLFFIDWLNFLLTRGQINSVICRESQPFEDRLVRCPSPKKPLASSADSLPRFGDMDPKSDMLASLEEDTIAFDLLENLSS
jgi:hypothetical protein